MADLGNKEQEFKDFLSFHGPQLKAMGLPSNLERRLFSKLRFQDFDFGERVQMMLDEEAARMYLRTIKDLKKNEDVFLVDHAWTFKHRTAYKDLQTHEKLVERMENILQFSSKRDIPGENPFAKKRPTLEEALKAYAESSEPVLAYDLDNYSIEELSKIQFREEVEEISLWDNQIHNPKDVTNILMKLPNLKALWLNENPVATNCANFNIIGDHFDKLEIFNSQLTSKAGEWAMLYYARDSGAKTLEEITSLDLSGKNLLMVEDISFLKKLTNLKHLDIGNNVDMYKPDAMLEAEAMQAAKGSGQENMDFKVNIHNRDVLLHNIPPVEHLICDIMLEAYILDTREHRHFLPNLKTINRVAIDIKDLGERTKIKKNLKIMDDVWKFIGTYRLVKPGVMDEEPCFYVMDEVGNSIDHSDKPNMRMAPLIYSPNNKADDPAAYTYSIVWPIEDVQKEHYLTRDFLQGITEAEWRSARLFPWFNVYEEYYQQEYQKFLDKKPDFNALERHEQYQTEYPSQSVIDWDVTQQGPIPVYTDYDMVQQYLTDKRFKIVENPKDAKILWLTEDYEQKRFLEWGIDFKTTHVNYFKKEGALVIKNALANLINNTLEDKSCIQLTFDLESALPQFIGCWLDRKKKGLENTWIIKPTAMARSMDTWVTNNCEQIVRLVETGPKVAQKYIERPITFKGRKIDLRYVILLKSLMPLQLYATNEFFIRFSNNQFTMVESTFQEYETHFTVMNYGGKDMTNVRCAQFMEMFDEEYKDRGITFAELNEKAFKAIKDVFVAFQTRYGKEIMDMGDLDNARACYGVDVMIDQDCNAKLLEVTFAPDMGRFCKFTPNGYNEVFGNLYFNECQNMTRIV